MKKLEEQVRVVSQTAEFPDSTSITVDFPRGKLRSVSARMTAKLRSVCGKKKGKSDHYHREVPHPMDGDVAKNQMDFMFIGAEGTFVDEPRIRTTVLMVICKDDGNLSATEVCVRKLMSTA